MLNLFQLESFYKRRLDIVKSSIEDYNLDDGIVLQEIGTTGKVKDFFTLGAQINQMMSVLIADQEKSGIYAMSVISRIMDYMDRPTTDGARTATDINEFDIEICQATSVVCAHKHQLYPTYGSTASRQPDYILFYHKDPRDSTHTIVFHMVMSIKNQPLIAEWEFIKNRLEELGLMNTMQRAAQSMFIPERDLKDESIVIRTDGDPHREEILTDFLINILPHYGVCRPGIYAVWLNILASTELSMRSLILQPDDITGKIDEMVGADGELSKVKQNSYHLVIRICVINGDLYLGIQQHNMSLRPTSEAGNVVIK